MNCLLNNSVYYCCSLYFRKHICSQISERPATILSTSLHLTVHTLCFNSRIEYIGKEHKKQLSVVKAFVLMDMSKVITVLFISPHYTKKIQKQLRYYPVTSDVRRSSPGVEIIKTTVSFLSVGKIFLGLGYISIPLRICVIKFRG